MVRLQIVNAGFFTAGWDGSFVFGVLCFRFPESCFPETFFSDAFDLLGTGAVSGVSSDRGVE